MTKPLSSDSFCSNSFFLPSLSIIWWTLDQNWMLNCLPHLSISCHAKDDSAAHALHDDRVKDVFCLDRLQKSNKMGDRSCLHHAKQWVFFFFFSDYHYILWTRWSAFTIRSGMLTLFMRLGIRFLTQTTSIWISEVDIWNECTSLYMLFALKVCWWFRVLKLVHPFRNLFHSATIHNPEERNNPLMRNSTFHSDCNAFSSKCVKWITLNRPPLDSSKTKRTGQCCALACNPNSQIFDFHLYMWIFQAFFFFCPVFEPHCKKIILSELNRSRVTNW